MYKIRIKHRGDVHSEYSVSTSRVLIGSAEDCDITLEPEKKVEPHHAVLEAGDEEVWTISPVDEHEVVSRGEPIEPSHELIVGHTFLVGEFVVSWEDETEPDIGADPYVEVTLPVAENPRMRLLTGAETGRIIEVTADLKANPATIGRDEEGNDIVLADRSVSRRHAVLREDENGYALEDAGSSNGLRASDGQVVYNLQLRNGMCLGIGDVELLFECPLKTMEGSDDSTAPHIQYKPTEEVPAEAEEGAEATKSTTADTESIEQPSSGGKKIFLLILLLVLLAAMIYLWQTSGNP